MAVAEHLMNQLVQRYGRKRGEEVYAAMVGEAKGPFAPGAKHYAEHVAWAKKNDVAPLTEADMKKPPTRR
jgi:hypothetical protein